jgi:N-acyl homoserine lactone hydrolase
MRLYVMQMGHYLPPGSPVPAYLIQTDDGTNVLVDSGLPRELVGAYRQPGYDGFAVDEEDLIVNRLAAIGVRPGDIRYVVCTHLDPDHAGGHDNFPEAEFIVQRSHYEEARSGQHDRFEWMRSHWDAPGLRYRTVEGDTTFLPGIDLIETSGHAPGHQSVLVRLPQTGPVLLAIDALPQALGETAPEERTAGPFDADEAQMRASSRKLVDLAAREGVTLIIHGHDAAQWATLRLSPQYYA